MHTQTVNAPETDIHKSVAIMAYLLIGKAPDRPIAYCTGPRSAPAEIRSSANIPATRPNWAIT